MYLSREDAIAKILAEKYHGEASAGFLDDRARIEAGEPWQYVLGQVDFLGCTIDLADRPMIPRDETAFWVKRVIEEWKDKGELRALDLFAGAGNIGLALLKHMPQATVALSELDALLLPGIARSLDLSGIDASRATLIAGDSLEHVTGTFDVICANPPYIDPHAAADMDPEMKHEPHIAFFGSSDGLGHTRELIARGAEFLTPRGVIYCECDMDQAPILRRELVGSPWKWEFWKDEFGNDGVLVLRR